MAGALCSVTSVIIVIIIVLMVLFLLLYSVPIIGTVAGWYYHNSIITLGIVFAVAVGYQAMYCKNETNDNYE